MELLGVVNDKDHVDDLFSVGLLVVGLSEHGRPISKCKLDVLFWKVLDH